MKLNRGLPKKSPLDDYRFKYDPVVLYPFEPNGRDKKLDAPRFATIDIETQDWINFVCGEVYWINSKGKEQAFETNNLFDLMLKCFEIAATEGIKNFVAHYGGKFDFLFFIKELLMSNECIVENIMPRGSSLLSFQAELCKTSRREVSFELPQKITFRDSSALLPFSLGSLTKSFNVETLKGEMDFLFVEQVYNEVDYLDDIVNDDRCILFYYGKQITKLNKNHRQRLDKLRYLNLDRFPLYYFRGKVSYVKPHKYSDKWFKDLTYPIFKKDDLLLYLHHDCKSLYQCIDAFFNAPLIKNAKKKWTTASQSVEVFRLFMKKRLHSLPDDDTFHIESDVDSFVRQAYFGGRTEIFKPVFDADINESDFLYYYDVNSLYPFCMRDHKYPDKFLGWSKSKAEYNKYDMSIWHCKVRVPEDIYAPPLPVKKDERLIFPVGEFKGYWTKYELEYAKTLGCEILELYEGAIFADAGYIFKDFVEKLYQMRLDAKEKNDNVTQMTMKLIMNSCYGRMGINKERTKIVFDDGTDHTVTLISEIETPRGWIRLATKPEKSDKMFSNPAIACFVTSYARVYLHTKIKEAGYKHIYYTDTDSCFTDVPMNTGKELGAMKLEYTCTSACFLLPKTYVNQGITEDNGITKPLKITMKGFDFKNIRNAFTFEDFFEYLNGDLGNIFVTEKAKFATFKTALKMGKFVAMKNDPVSKKESDIQKEEDHFKKTGKRKKFTKDEYKVSVRKLQGFYGKRTITNNGFDSEPLRVYE